MYDVIGDYDILKHVGLLNRKWFKINEEITKNLDKHKYE